jgi:hypothetical protein
MAEMNLLKANFTGSLGRVTGSEWKGKPVVKSRIFSKAPPSKAQTQSVRAFEALNRLSAAVAKEGFPYMGLSTKTLLPHNAVAKFLKPAIENHIFDVANLSKIMPKDGDQAILGFTHNKSTEQATLQIGLGPNYVPLTGTKTFINVFNQFGYSFFSDFIDTADYSKSFFMPYSEENEYNCLIFMSEPAYKGVFLHGLDFKQGVGMKYSTDEQLTGDLWLDGRPIYQKTIDFGLLPTSASTKTVPHNIQNLDYITSYEVFTAPKGDNGRSYFIPSGNSSDQTELSSDKTSVYISASGGGWSAGYYATYTIRYVKTSDIV